jgi:two-component system, sensor histidine kinase LadS
LVKALNSVDFPTFGNPTIPHFKLMIRFLALAFAHYLGKALKCMRSGQFSKRALVLLGAWLLAMGAAYADHSSSVVIADSERDVFSANAFFWHEKPAKVGIEQASDAKSAANYMPLLQETMFDLKPQDHLWVRLDIDRKDASMDHLSVWIPLPLIDSVTLYQKQADGNWRVLKAGDRVAVASWPEPGRYPRFQVDLAAKTSSLYLQVQGSTPLSLPIYMGSEVHAQAADREGFLGLGLMIGVLLTLVLVCIVTAYTYRDRLYLLYGGYMLIMILAVGSYTGLAAYLLWDQSPRWADASQGALAILTAGGALYFIEALLGGRQFAHRLSAFLLGLGVLALPLALLYCFVPRSMGVAILGVYMLLVSGIGLSLASRAWKRGYQVGKWVFLAYAPLVLAVLLAIARAYGWISVSWVVQYGVVIALLIEAPMMMVALNVRSRERHEIRTREQAMATQDALTGLLKEHIFDDRVRQTMARAIKRRDDSVIIVISLVNYEAIIQAHGLPVAEQSVLRAVIKLRKVLRDVETVARVGTSHFGLILEGVTHRSRVTEIGARLIAQGLMPLPGLVPEVTLQFHIAAALMCESPAHQRDLKAELMDVLNTMSRRTRRPIRFWEPTVSGGTPLTATPALNEAARPSEQAINDPHATESTWDTTQQDDSSAFGSDTLPIQKSKL